ncbi:MAG: CinA family protein [Lachnospiraceae bacterium]|nr:CinA family protein [Lachnospiraceae bacterium]
MYENILGRPTPVVNEKTVRENYKKLTNLLIDNKLSITTMESATSGQIASLITDTEGASSIFKGAYVTYSNEMKIKCGVPAETIERYSVYSKETAEAMAVACKEAFGADIGIGVTGTMGNVDPANLKASQPGIIYYAISIGDKIASYERKLFPQPSRYMYKLAVADMICSSIMELIEEVK